jgi:hypothetical protein
VFDRIIQMIGSAIEVNVFQSLFHFWLSAYLLIMLCGNTLCVSLVFSGRNNLFVG